MIRSPFKKLQSTTTTPWTYVTTTTVYGDDNTTWWGLAKEVTEDSGGIARFTKTDEYDRAGRAKKVIDAADRQFTTNYDADGRVQSVVQGSTPVVTYQYGTSPALLNGVVIAVADELSGVEQTFSYQSAAGGGYGQVSSVHEQRDDDTSTQSVNEGYAYDVSYTYTLAGERETAVYDTDNGLYKWGYYDYVSLGDPQQKSRVFQTLNKLHNTSGEKTAEEFHYMYSQLGTLQAATFAMTPQSGQTTYNATYPAATRALAFYQYDSGGRLEKLHHWWDTWNSGTSSYGQTGILGNEYDYDDLTGQKNENAVLSGSTLNHQRTEEYTYDNELGYLLSVDYNDGLANESVSWTYDAAGNRASDSSNSGTWSYDNLNKMTASPGFTYGNDVLGNRTDRSGGTALSYDWDVLNRMIAFTAGTAESSYAYRADGMRVWKSGSSHTKFAYDGQMGIEDVTAGSPAAVVSYGLGARGIDRIEKAVSSSTVAYPVYDGHGNMIATLSKSGSSFALAEQRSYGVWGGLRSGSTSGDPTGRYCANIGHKQDDESALVYMRARYYEAATGRFVTEDPAMEGANWYIYCENNPVDSVDPDGRSVFAAVMGLLKFLLGHLLMDMTGPITLRIAQIERYMATLDDLIAAANTANNWADQALEMRKEVVGLRKMLKRFQMYEKLRTKAAAAGNVIAKLMGRLLVISALIDDIELAPDGLGSLDAVYGS